MLFSMLLFRKGLKWANVLLWWTVRIFHMKLEGFSLNQSWHAKKVCKKMNPWIGLLGNKVPRTFWAGLDKRLTAQKYFTSSGSSFKIFILWVFLWTSTNICVKRVQISSAVRFYDVKLLEFGWISLQPGKIFLEKKRHPGSTLLAQIYLSENLGSLWYIRF